MKVDLNGKVALVTGSTRGIGKTIALALAENGADIVVNGRSREHGLEVVNSIKGMGREAAFENADIHNYQEVKQMVANILERLGKIDILVANGGGGPESPMPELFHKIDPDVYIGYAKTYWLCRANCIRAVLDHMIERKAGKIININTDAGRIPTPGESMVGAGAAAMNQMTKVFAKEFSRWLIRINTICITVTEGTPGFDRALAGGVGHVFKKAEKGMPFGINKPHHVSDAVLFFASENSDQITGQILSVNGGLSFPG